HNVPAWAIFGLFFITIPIAGNMIREREDGSLIRIKMIPGSYYPILLGKLGFYVLLGLLQFTVMIAVGYWLMPVLGLDSLHIGNAYGQIALAVLVIACTATAWGVMIGTLFQTPNQALPFGAISIVILSAIGGIWVPVEILPAALQGLARISPLFWSLDLINDLFLRGASFASIAPKILVLLAFTSAFILVSGWVEARRRK
ncbi:MAG TPA: ABC transporter permease, partial [Flavihumibacter sp.]